LGKLRRRYSGKQSLHGYFGTIILTSTPLAPICGKESVMTTKDWFRLFGAIISAALIGGGTWGSVRWDHNQKLTETLNQTKTELGKRTSDLKSAQQTIILLRKQHIPAPGAKKDMSLAGRYEWQWADDAWRGYVTVGKNGAATIQMNLTRDCPDAKSKTLPITKPGPSGTVEPLRESEKLHVKIPVQFVKYATGCDGKDDPGPTLLEGDLSRYTAYAGTVTYTGPDGKTSLGDMVLVKDWFSGIHSR
jgi:hypothetical protein